MDQPDTLAQSITPFTTSTLVSHLSVSLNAACNQSSSFARTAEMLTRPGATGGCSRQHVIRGRQFRLAIRMQNGGSLSEIMVWHLA